MGPRSYACRDPPRTLAEKALPPLPNLLREMEALGGSSPEEPSAGNSTLGLSLPHLENGRGPLAALLGIKKNGAPLSAGAQSLVDLRWELGGAGHLLAVETPGAPPCWAGLAKARGRVNRYQAVTAELGQRCLGQGWRLHCSSR